MGETFLARVREEIIREAQLVGQGESERPNQQTTGLKDLLGHMQPIRHVLVHGV